MEKRRDFSVAQQRLPISALVVGEETTPPLTMQEMERLLQPETRTIKKGTIFFSGMYPDAGKPIAKAGENITIRIYRKGTMSGGLTGWTFFKTNRFFPASEDTAEPGEEPGRVAWDPKRRRYVNESYFKKGAIRDLPEVRHEEQNK